MKINYPLPRGLSISSRFPQKLTLRRPCFSGSGPQAGAGVAMAGSRGGRRRLPRGLPNRHARPQCTLTPHLPCPPLLGALCMYAGRLSSFLCPPSPPLSPLPFPPSPPFPSLPPPLSRVSRALRPPPSGSQITFKPPSTNWCPSLSLPPLPSPCRRLQNMRRL